MKKSVRIFFIFIPALLMVICLTAFAVRSLQARTAEHHLPEGRYLLTETADALELVPYDKLTEMQTGTLKTVHINITENGRYVFHDLYPAASAGGVRIWPANKKTGCLRPLIAYRAVPSGDGYIFHHPEDDLYLTREFESSGNMEDAVTLRPAA